MHMNKSNENLPVHCIACTAHMDHSTWYNTFCYTFCGRRHTARIFRWRQPHGCCDFLCRKLHEQRLVFKEPCGPKFSYSSDSYLSSCLFELYRLLRPLDTFSPLATCGNLDGKCCIWSLRCCIWTPCPIFPQSLAPRPAHAKNSLSLEIWQIIIANICEVFVDDRIISSVEYSDFPMFPFLSATKPQVVSCLIVSRTRS